MSTKVITDPFISLPSIQKRGFAGAGFFWLIFLFGLGAIDYLTRAC